jgi:hypothetical protein
MLDEGRYRRFLDILAEAQEVDAASRSAFLDRACGDDRELRSEIENHLAHKTEASRIVAAGRGVKGPGGPVGRPAVRHSPRARPAGALHGDPLLKGVPEIDGFKVLEPCVLFERVGAGGMGAVFRAWHLDFEMEVAVNSPSSIAP